MARTRYVIQAPDKPHFLTCTVVEWLPVFTRPDAVQILSDSWTHQRENLDEIAKAFNVGTHSSVSSVVNRTGSQLRTESRLKKSYQQIYASLNMSQAKT